MRNIYDLIKSKVNIVDCIEKFSNIKLFDVGNGKYRGHHTSHASNSKKSLHVDENLGRYRCYNCGSWGSIIDYVVSLNEGMSIYEATLLIADQFGITIENENWNSQQQQEYRDRQEKIQSVERCFIDAIDFYHDQLGENRLYFHSRGISDETIEKLMLGYAPANWNLLFRHLKSKGYDKDTMMKTGMIYEKNGRTLPFFYDRYIFPYFKNTRPCYVSGRDASKDGSYIDSKTGKKVDVAKYLKLAITDKVDDDVIQHQLWGVNRLRIPKRKLKNKINVKEVNRSNDNDDKSVIHENIEADPPPKIVITEGIIDAILSYQELSKYGWITISPTTNNLSGEDVYDLVDLLESYPGCEMVFCFDSDDAGQRGAVKSAKECHDSIYYRLVIEYLKKEMNINPSPSGIEELLKDLSLNKKEFKNMVNSITGIMPVIKIATIPKPEDIDKIDLSDMFLMDKSKEVLYWIEAARTIKEYDMMINDDPSRFFEGSSFYPKKMSDDICMSGRVFFGMKKQLFEYEDGIFIESETKLKKDINILLKDSRRTKLNNEVVQDIKNTYGITDGNMFTQKDIINFKNGLMALSPESQDYIQSIPTCKYLDGMIFSHSPDIPMVCQIPINYDHNSECPKIDKFISEIVNEDDIPILYELVGYCMHTSTDMEKAFILIGDGSNGKSTYIKLVEKLLGNNNISHITMQDLEISRFRYAELFGKLANFYADIPNTPLAKVDKFNTVVTGDTIQAEKKNKDPFEFKPYSTLLFSCNLIPESHTKTKGYYRRIIPIRFPFEFGDGKNSEKEREHQTKLIDRISTTEELQGFAKSSLVHYANAFKNGTFTISDNSKVEMDIYRKENQPELEFITDPMICVIGNKDEYKVGSNELYDTYKDWLTNFNPRLKPVSSNEFFNNIKALYSHIDKIPSRIHGKAMMVIRGIGLVDLDQEDDITLEDNIPL